MANKGLTPEQAFFRAIPQLSVLEDDRILELASKTRKRKYYQGEHIFFQGDQVNHLFILEMGKVEIYKSDVNGRKLTLWFIEESELFCLATLFAQTSFTSAQAVRDSLIYSISREDFELLMASSRALSRNLLRCICGKLAAYASRVDDLAFRKIEARLARTLLQNLAPRGKQFCCHLSQEELAAMVGTSREVVGRCLKSLRERDLLTISKTGRPRTITVLNTSDLERLIDSE